MGLHGIIVFDIFFINPNSRPLPTFLPFPHGTRRRILACRPHTTGAIPSRQAEALHRRALAGSEAHLGANHPDTLISMNNLAMLLRQQGKLAEAGLRSLDGERRPSWRRFFRGIFFVWPRPEAWILSFRFPNIGWIAFLGVIHCWDLHPHFIVVIGKMKIWQTAKLSNLLGEFLQMNANEAYSIYRRMLNESITSPGPPYCSHLRDARRRPCTAELLQGAKRTSVRITQRRSPP